MLAFRDLYDDDTLRCIEDVGTGADDSGRLDPIDECEAWGEFMAQWAILAAEVDPRSPEARCVFEAFASAPQFEDLDSDDRGATAQGLADGTDAFVEGVLEECGLRVP